MLRRRAWLRWMPGGVLLALAWLGWDASSTQACSTDPCFNPVRTFGEGARVPGNLVRFELSNESQFREVKLSLKHVDGTVVPLMSRVANGKQVLEPEEAIAAGTELELHYEYTCFAVVSLVYRFWTSDPAPLAPQPAKLTAVPWSNKYIFDPPVAPSAAHLVDHHVTVDGRTLGDLTSHGQDDARDGLIEVPAACDGTLSGDSCGSDYNFAAGSHQLRVSTTIVGEEAQPDPVQLEIETTCTGCSVLGPGAVTSGGAPWWPLVFALALVTLARRAR